jgi:hypothetical protein
MNMKPTKVKETETQKKLREAQELVKAAKEAEQQAWRDRWQSQQADPEYQRKQAERTAKSEERSRKMAIGKENNFFARIEKIRKQTFADAEQMEHTAYHEAGHAVIAEVLANGVSKATILPEATEVKDANNSSSLEVKSLGHVMPNGNLPISPRQQALIKVAYLRAGGLATAYANPYDDHSWGWGTGNDEKQIVEVIEAYGYKSGTKEHEKFRNEATELCWKMLQDAKVWQAVEDVKDMLLMEYTISGEDIRAIVKKQYYPELVDIDVTRQYCFRFRKNRVVTRWGGETGASFVLGINVHANSYGYYSGYCLSQPKYVEEVTKANVHPVPFPVKPIKFTVPNGQEITLPTSIQMPFQFPPQVAAVAAVVAPTKVRKSRRKKAA